MTLLAPAAAAAGTFSVLTYNVRGLPDELIEDRSDEIHAIAPLLEDFHTPAPPYIGMRSFVGLQEVFDDDYYEVLTNPARISYRYVTSFDDAGFAELGDGLVVLSDLRIDRFQRIGWDDCYGRFGDDGSDCDADKGFNFTRVGLEDEIQLDVYTLHADSGQDSGSRAARRGNIRQLVDEINERSPAGTAVVVLGDVNARYTRFPEDNAQELLAGAGLTDVWVELRRGGIVPSSGTSISGGCATDPGGAECELVDKIFYRDGRTLDLVPQRYDVLKEMFSDENGDLSDHLPVAATFEYTVVAAVSTTTTTSSTSSTSTSSTASTSTTIGAERPCGDPVASTTAGIGMRAEATGDQQVVAASDALFVLNAAVGNAECPLCTCDVDNSGTVAATDSLRVLKYAVGQAVTLDCPTCV